MAGQASQCESISCDERPGINAMLSSPLDFLVSPRNRVTYSILFAVMGTGLVNGYGNFGSILRIETSNLYSQVFNKICKYNEDFDCLLWNHPPPSVFSPFLTVITLVLEYFPLFATVEFHIPIVGYFIGFVYSMIWWEPWWFDGMSNKLRILSNRFATIWVPRFIDYRRRVEVCSLTNPSDRAVVSLSLITFSSPITLSLLLSLLLPLTSFLYRQQWQSSGTALSFSCALTLFCGSSSSFATQFTRRFYAARNKWYTKKQ